jgi:cobalt/nickel transport system permease protein
MDARRIPVVGFLAAVVLVLQLLNFPLIGSTSGHLTGTTLLIFVAGVEVAAVAMASVLALQALLFQDGGLLAIGANYVNMVVVPALVALPFLPAIRGAHISARRTAVIAGIAAWCGSVAGALSCAAQVAVAGVAPMRVALTWMGGCHALVGLVEGALTGVAVAALARRGLLGIPSQTSRPDTPPRTRHGWFAPVLALAVIAAVLVPLASSRPDVLETLLHQAGRGDTPAR